MSDVATIPAKQRAKRRIDPYSRPGRWAKVDGRSNEAVLARDVRAALVQHVGGNPSAVQSILIQRAVMLSVHLAMMDRKALEDGALSLHASRQYLAWNNGLTRTVRELGLRGASDVTAATLQDLLATSSGE